MALQCDKLFFTPKEIAQTLQLNVLTIYGYVKSKKLTAVKFGRSYRIDKRDLDIFIKANKTK
ncbi:hypothetical protein A2960_01680 [Candidatus Gottesmanbacteria bacterium RIFCSPLOWO2_01_FULL_39_12b]|uniref:Helix-turn-helix domain-containing protein n=1 Tax=Candidatus Gottesmanbacteria bacterium RIFCSPLOWO2_01_FULL_39_12b TaxID=1798388 RepID=A0A1F6AQ87_9BACT|nr:MAG: hypothetical protein A2960_01680 [Candidatus Gottesmanbacteria bacterium RIFCSPLOWO2_01_FULL_39_12b]